MSDTVISVENLSKAYRLGQIGTGMLTHDLKVWFAKVRGKPNPLLKIGQTDHDGLDEEIIWALKDVSFRVEQGEALGIIGRNGAGKSTLLKILSEVTAPTNGEVKIKGRIASLLEVGTGFHPDLTGRENTYLNGAILGMTRTEISRKFDEIVEFSGVEKFIDTPVKRYSSGMYVRLAFAVAAHLEPEILVVDEVLAVGDAAFQKKCLGKMGDVAEEGRTVLFVSHNMRAVKTLCSRAILLEDGTPIIDDHPEIVIAHYLSSNIVDQGSIMWERGTAPKTSEMALRAIRIMDKDGRLISSPSSSDPIDVEIEYDLLTNIRGLRVSLTLLTEDGIAVLSSSDRLVHPDSRPPGSYVSRCRIPGDLLNIGAYVVSVGVDIPTYKVLLPEREYLRFIITELMNNPMGLGSQPPAGMINPKLDWEVEMR